MSSLEEAYYQSVPKYALVLYLTEELFRQEGEPELTRERDGTRSIKTLLNRKKLLLIEWMFKTYPDHDFPPVDYYEKFPRPSNIVKNIQRKTGINEMSEEEALALMEEQDYSHIHEGKNPLGKFSGDDKIILLDHQRRFLNGFLIGNLRCSIMFHGVGTGKTFTAVATIKMYLQLYPTHKVHIITPPAVMFNFIDSLIKYGINPQDPRFKYFSYSKYANNKIDSTNALVIIDEAHNLRTEIKATFITNDDGMEIDSLKKGMRPAKIILKTEKAHKVICLTATPFVNIPYDIENLIAIGEGRPPLLQNLFGEMISNDDNFYDYFKYQISSYNRKFEKGDFPEERERYIPIVVDNPSDMKDLDSKEKKDRIEALEGLRALASKSNPAYTFSRIASLQFDGIKFDWVMNEIMKEPDKKYVIYTAFLDKGVKEMIMRLNAKGIRNATITGRVKTIDKAQNIDGYNNFHNEDYYNNKYQVLIITKSGSEGVNLLETRGIFVIDGVWNDALYEQIVARAIRYKSHHNLPENERYVNVYKLFVCFQAEKHLIEKLDNGEGFDFQKFINDFKQLKVKLKENKNRLKELNEEDTGNSLMSKTSRFTLSKSDYDPDVLKSLKGEERKKYIEEKLKFGKDRAKYDTEELINLVLKKIPSTDFYMFILQRNKQNKINQMITQLKEVPNTEKAIEDIPDAKELMNKVNDLYTENKQIDIVKLLIEALRNEMNATNRTIKREINTSGSRLDELKNASYKLALLNREKASVRVNQEFFTPDYIVKELLELSGITKEDKFSGGSILEPSAGMGNIVRGLLEVQEKRKLMYKIDMVEPVENNRKHLHDYAKEIPAVLNLCESRDFLSFIPSHKYNYCIMNPPFKLTLPKYEETVYGYHFVMRAFAMLKVNGVLTAIIFHKDKDIPEFKAFMKIINKKHSVEDYTKNYEWKGNNLKKGSEINNLKCYVLYIKKLVDNSEFDEDLLLRTKDLIISSAPAPTDNFGGRKEEPEEPEEPKNRKIKVKPKFVVKQPTQLDLPETEATDIDEILNNLDDFIHDKPALFVCYNEMSLYFILTVLNKNKKTCIFPYFIAYDRNKPKKIELSDIQNMDNNTSFHAHLENVRAFNADTDEHYHNLLFEKYQMCKKNGELLFVNMNHILTGHANGLILNPFLNTIEHYEPHGQYMGNQKKHLRNQKVYEKITTYFDRRGEKMTFVPASQTCPRYPESLKNQIIASRTGEDRLKDGFGIQSLGGWYSDIDRKKTDKGYKTTTDEGIEYQLTETDGFCCAYTYLYLDFRLKNPRLEPHEASTKLIRLLNNDNVKDTANRLIGFMRGYIMDTMKDMIKELGIVNVGNALTKGRQNTDAISKLKQYIHDLFKKINKVDKQKVEKVKSKMSVEDNTLEKLKNIDIGKDLPSWFDDLIEDDPNYENLIEQETAQENLYRDSKMKNLVIWNTRKSTQYKDLKQPQLRERLKKIYIRAYKRFNDGDY